MPQNVTAHTGNVTRGHDVAIRWPGKPAGPFWIDGTRMSGGLC